MSSIKPPSTAKRYRTDPLLTATNEPRRRGRKLRVVIRHGFEVSENAQLRQLQRFRPVPPRGWCKKYWWDNALPEYEHEIAGCQTVYTPKHEQAIQAVNTSLGIALADETRFKKKKCTLDSQRTASSSIAKNGTSWHGSFFPLQNF